MAKLKQDAELYDVPALVISPEAAPVIRGNYEDIEKTLNKWKAKVTALQLSEKNLDEVQAIKKAAVAVRNRLKDAIDETKRRLFNDPKSIFEARAKQLTNLVADVEACADSVLDKLEQHRIAGIDQVLEHYKAICQEKYQLDDSFLNKVVFLKDFYNRTLPRGYASMDKYWKEKIEAQFIELKAEQNALAANVRLIRAACKEDARLNPEHWIERLERQSAAEILEEIATEKERLNTVCTSTENTASSVSAEDEAPTKLGVPSTLNFNTDFPGRTSSVKVKITYPCDVGDALTGLFEHLEQFGITIKYLNEKETIF